MISLIVYLMSGHYRKPGTVGNMGHVASYPVAPPSTIIGFLESLCGMESGTFKGSFSYGWVKRPAAMGVILRKDHVWSSSGDSNQGKNPYPTDSEVLRPVLREMMFDFVLNIMVQGPSEERIRAALRGEVTRYGVLSLGESDNVVSWLQEGQEDAVEWVIPGNRMLLPIKSGRGYDVVNPVYKSFNYSKPCLEPPETAWLQPIA